MLGLGATKPLTSSRRRGEKVRSVTSFRVGQPRLPQGPLPTSVAPLLGSHWPGEIWKRASELEPSEAWKSLAW